MDFSGKKILVIDDSELTRMYVESILKELSIEVVQASNGIEGIEEIKSNDDIDFVFCDVNMPELDGISMLRRIKEENIVLRPPVVMVTTETELETAKSAASVGAKGWIVKPINKEIIVDMLGKLLAA